jgi:hypothetical protein
VCISVPSGPNSSYQKEIVRLWAQKMEEPIFEESGGFNAQEAEGGHCGGGSDQQTTECNTVREKNSSSSYSVQLLQEKLPTDHF